MVQQWRDLAYVHWRYPVEEVQRYERACLYFDPAEVALQTVN